MLARQLSALALVTTLTAACGGGSSSSARSAEPRTSEPAVTELVVELGEITLFEADAPVFKLHADGTTEMGVRSGRMDLVPGKTASSDSLPMHMKPGPTIAADGTISAKGKPVARIELDGISAIATNERLPFTLSADSVTASGRGFALAADGTITLIGATKPLDKPLRVEGADSPGKRRTLLALLGMMMLGGRDSAETSGAGAGSSTPAH